MTISHVNHSFVRSRTPQPYEPPEQLSLNRSFIRPNTLVNHQSNPHSIALSPNPLENHPLEYHPPEYVRLTYVLKALQLQLYLQVEPLELGNIPSRNRDISLLNFSSRTKFTNHRTLLQTTPSTNELPHFRAPPSFEPYTHTYWEGLETHTGG